MEPEQHFIGKVAQKAIITKEGKVLLTRDPRTPEYWELPGGRLNIDEAPEDGLKREIREELGITIEVKGTIYIKQFLQGTEKASRALVIVYIASVEPGAKLTVDAREVCEVAWFTEQEVASLKLFPEYKEALQRFFL